MAGTVLLLLWGGWVAAQSAPPLTICADPDPPPWTYWKRDAQGQKTSEFIGSSVDLVRVVFSRLGRPITLVGEYPWARCLLMVEMGKMDFAMGAYYDDQRAKRFTYSTHYNTLTPQIYYRATHPVVIAQLGDLKKYRGCGMVGASYGHYGLSPTDLDLGLGYDGLVKKLKAGRCDYFVEELEVIASYKMMGNDYLADPAIRHGPVPGAMAPAKHLIAAKGSAAAALMPQINATIEATIKSGEAVALWKKHAPDLPYQP